VREARVTAMVRAAPQEIIGGLSRKWTCAEYIRYRGRRVAAVCNVRIRGLYSDLCSVSGLKRW
jgi:hypothetical protein